MPVVCNRGHKHLRDFQARACDEEGEHHKDEGLRIANTARSLALKLNGHKDLLSPAARQDITDCLRHFLKETKA